MSSIDILGPSSRKLVVYTDFNKNMKRNPLTGDLAILTNEDSIKEALKNLLLTDRGERLFQPALGGDIRKMLFDVMTPASIQMIKQGIETVINNFEPRVNLIDVKVDPELDRNGVHVTISYYARNVQDPITISLFLERDR
jgi:phage baseplate assembly protein W